MTDFNFDTAIKLAEVASMLGGAGLVAFRLGRVTQKFEAAVRRQSEVAEQQKSEISEIKGDVKKLNTLITDMALEKQRIGMLEKRLDDLAHGRGFIDVEVRRRVARVVT